MTLDLIDGTLEAVNLLLDVLRDHFRPSLVVVRIGQQRDENLVDETGQLVDRTGGQISDHEAILATFAGYLDGVLLDEINSCNDNRQ